MAKCEDDGSTGHDPGSRSGTGRGSTVVVVVVGPEVEGMLDVSLGLGEGSSLPSGFVSGEHVKTSFAEDDMVIEDGIREEICDTIIETIHLIRTGVDRTYI